MYNYVVKPVALKLKKVPKKARVTHAFVSYRATETLLGPRNELHLSWHNVSQSLN